MEKIISGNEQIIKAVYLLNGKVSQKHNFKPSVFNYVCSTPGGYLIYNTLYNTLLRVTNTEYAKILGEKHMGKALSRAMEKNGIIIEKKIDEFKIYETWAKQQRKINKPYWSFNITTTLKCNARCPYCYEKGIRKTDFKKSHQAKLLEFIKSNLKEGDKLVINWFGGEPLMKTEVIDYVTNELSKDNIKFSSYIITNGSLVNKKLIQQKFRKWNVKDVQITLDGLSNTYENRKLYIDQRRGVFNRLLKKIFVLSECGIKVHIRLNIDRDNSDEILELVSILDEKFGSSEQVTWYPAFLTGIGDDWSENDKIEFIKNMFIRITNPAKMNAAKRLHSMPKSSPCMRNDPHSMSVDVNGNIYTCEHCVGRSEEAIGTLSYLDANINRKRAEVRLRKECKKCVFLPKCMGGCASNLETDDEPCMIEKYIIQGYLAYMADK